MRRRFAPFVVALLALAVLGVPVAAHGGHAGSYPARIDLPDGWRPEGITAGRRDLVYVGSLANGAIRKIHVKSGAGETLVPGIAGKVAVGVEYDFRNDRIWVAGGPTGEVRVYRARTGTLLRTYTFPTTGFLNDLVVTRRAVYVTDSGINELKVIPLGPRGKLLPTTSARTLPLDGFPFVAGEFNANGIVAKDGRLIVVNSFTGELFRVHPRTGAAREIDLGGASVTFGDGLELRGRTLYVVRNQLDHVAVFKLARNLRSAAFQGTITDPGLDVPTTVAYQDGRLWAVNARFGAPPPPDDFWITRLPARP